MTQPEDDFLRALAAVQAKLPQVKKSRTATVPTKTGGTYTYGYADLGAIAAAIHPLLSEHGLVFITTPRFTADRYVLVGTLQHINGGSAVGHFPLPQDVPPQQLGSWLTYGRRYLLGCLTGVVAEEDDDGKAASEPADRPKRQRRTPTREDSPATDPDAISKPQQAKLHLLFNANGLRDRDERLAFTSGLIKREITTSSELTKDEASRLIDHLEHLAAS